MVLHLQKIRVVIDIQETVIDTLDLELMTT